MANLVAIPWQPSFLLTPDTLALLVAAGNRLNTRLRVSDAWRSYAEQFYYWDKYINHGGNPASNPDTGQRNHMRGAAFDLVRTDAAVQAACRAVGLIRDADESWHWNNPNWASMPIIPDNTSTAYESATQVGVTVEEEDDDMKYELGSDAGSGIYVLGPQGVSAVPGGRIQLPLFQRLVAGERKFTNAEWKAIDQTLNRRL